MPGPPCICAFQTPPPRRLTDVALNAVDAFRQRRVERNIAFPPPRPVFVRGPTRQPPPDVQGVHRVHGAGPGDLRGRAAHVVDRCGFRWKAVELRVSGSGPGGHDLGQHDDVARVLVRGYDGSSRESAVRRRRRRVRFHAASRWPRAAGLFLAGLVGVVVGGSLVLGAMPVCLSYSKSADLAKAAAPYVAVRALALPAALIASVAQAACLGLRDATTPGLSVAIAAVLNLMGDFVLVPRQGLLGRGDCDGGVAICCCSTFDPVPETERSGR